MCFPVLSPWLPGYINVTPTVLSILTMAGLFLETTLHILSFLGLLTPKSRVKHRIVLTLIIQVQLVLATTNAK